MVIHKKTRLTEHQRKEICDAYNKKNQRVSDLSREYHVTRPTIYKIIHRGRLKDFSVHNSTNGKAERMIRTLMEMWHNKIQFQSSAHRKTELVRFINYYNGVKPHKGIEGLTPEEKLKQYFCPDKL